MPIPRGATQASRTGPGCIHSFADVLEIEARRAWLLEQAVDQLRTAGQLARELPWIAGVTITAERIGMWAARDKPTRLPVRRATSAPIAARADGDGELLARLDGWRTSIAGRQCRPAGGALPSTRSARRA